MRDKYLKPKQYYIERYDEVTVVSCRQIENRFREEFKPKNHKKLTEKERATLAAYRLMIYFETGERYLNKDKTIKKLMDEDAEKDMMLESANPPENIKCLNCGDVMNLESKFLHGENIDEKERVVFMFRCQNTCKKGRAFYENGEEWLRKLPPCKKCGGDINSKSKRANNIITTIYTCLDCGNSETDKMDLNEKPKKEKADKYYERDRSRFCLNEKEGQKYFDAKMQLENMKNLMQDIEERNKKKHLYDRVKKLKKLNLVELEKYLTKKLEKESYIKLSLGQPELGKDVRVDFTVQESDSKRDNWDSKNNLKKIITKSLVTTNWRLMSGGIQCRLGILSGRLRGYEKEDDLVKLI